jgi:hypothetical protein
MSSDPYPLYAAVSEHCPVTQVEGLGWYAALSFETVEQVLLQRGGSHGYVEFQKMRAPDGDQQPYCKAAMDFVFVMEGNDHRRVRGAFTRAFTKARVDALRPFIRKNAHELIDGFQARSECELMASFCRPLPLATISAMLGVSPQDQAKVAGLISGYALAFQFFPLDGTQVAATNDAVLGLQEYFGGLVARRREQPPGEDLMFALIAEADAGNLSEAELLAQVYGLYAVGHETTAMSMGNSTLCFLDHPDQLEIMRSDPALVPGAVSETMRHHGLVQGTQRIFTEDIEVAGHTVPAGTPIVAFLASANRDDAAFPDPDRFDVTRARTAPHLAFGRGAHACAGQQLALAQLEIGIEVLFERLPGLALAGEVEWNTTSLVFHGPDRLPVRWDVP